MPYPLHLPDCTEQLPTSWGDTTLHQYTMLKGADSVFNCLLVLSGTSAEQLLSLTPAALGQAIDALAFLLQPIPELMTWARPASLMLGDVEVPILDTLDTLTFGQAADIGAAIQELAEDLPALRLRVLAIILQPAYDGAGYDSDRVAALEIECGAVLLREALPVTDFFLPSSTASAAPMPPTSNPFPSPATSGPPASKPSPRTGIRWPSWMRWPRATKPAGTTSSPAPG